MTKFNVGDAVLVYYCPNREMLSLHEILIDDKKEDEAPMTTTQEEAYDKSSERMTSFDFHEGIVIDPGDSSYSMEGDYDWELCVALDDENEDRHNQARTFRTGEKLNVWDEGPYYGGYAATAVIVKKEQN